MYTGHKLNILTMRPAFKNLSIDDWKKVGKYTMFVSLFIYLLGILGIIFNFQ
jgi:small-conductance mechanosensitive channel